MWTTKERVMTTLQNEPCTRTIVNHRRTYTKLENRLNPEGARVLTYKQLGIGDTPEVNASVGGMLNHVTVLLKTRLLPHITMLYTLHQVISSQVVLLEHHAVHVHLESHNACLPQVTLSSPVVSLLRLVILLKAFKLSLL